MTDREKLVEIVCNAIQEVDCISHCNHPPCYKVHHVVDELISHGVTVREPQKPLTVEELKEGAVVWLEVFKHPIFYLYIRELRFLTRGTLAEFKRFGNSLTDFHSTHYYGKTWRCWAEKPTEEERKAAEWET